MLSLGPENIFLRLFFIFSVTEGRIVCILIGCIRVCVFELECLCVCTYACAQSAVYL